MIGKRLTAVKETEIEDVELMNDIVTIKKHLKKKWTDIHNKAKKENGDNAPAKKTDDNNITKLPHIPQDLKHEFDIEDMKRNERRIKLLDIYQTPPKNCADTKYSLDMLRKGAEAAIATENALEKWAGSNDQKKLDKFRQLIYILSMKHTELKLEILEGKMKAERVVDMQ